LKRIKNKKKKKKKKMNGLLLQKISLKGAPISAFFGVSGKTSKKAYLLGVYSKLQMINPEVSFLGLYRACRFLEQLSQQKKKIRILFLNSNPEFSKIVKNNAIFCKQYYINTKWVGGTLTNWKQISQSIEAFDLFHSKWGRLCQEISFPRLEKYKKCFAGFLDKNSSKKRNKLQFYEKIKKSREAKEKNKPDILIIVDPLSQQVAIKEAHSQNIPVIALVNEGSDVCNEITYPIIGNNQSFRLVAFCIGWIARVIKKD
jgi:small subunit ribosomal protein S2